jgi:hypothetical protein
LLVFVHIQKTAGYSLRKILLREYGGRSHVQLLPNVFTRPQGSFEEVRRIAAEPPEGLRVIHGHIMFWPEIVWSPSTRFFTLLRDPVERVISHFYWLRERSTRFSEKVELDDAVCRGAIPDNLQTRVLSASVAPVGELPDKALEQAIASLDRFTVVGLTERFDETLVLLSREFGWRRTTYERANVTPERTPRKEIPPETVELIQHLNSLDMKLYAHARTRFDRDVARQGDGFRIEAAALRLANQRSAPGDGAPHAELPRLRDSLPPGPVDVQQLLIDTQADLLVREEARLAESEARKAAEMRLEMSTKRTAHLEHKLAIKQKRNKELEAKLREARKEHLKRLASVRKANDSKVRRLERKISGLSQKADALQEAVASAQAQAASESDGATAAAPGGYGANADPAGAERS